MKVRRYLAAAAVALAASVPGTASAQADCRTAVVLTLPGVTWAEVHRVQPDAILATARAGAVGSMSVRTVSARSTYSSGFATLGAGTRLEGPRLPGTPIAAISRTTPPFDRIRVGALDEIRDEAEDDGYGAVPGSLASTLGEDRVFAIGNGDPGFGVTPAGPVRGTLFSAMDDTGTVARAATGTDLLRSDSAAPFGVRTDPDAIRRVLDEALGDACGGVVFIDHGDLTRADVFASSSPTKAPDERRRALLAADGLVQYIRARLTSDDLLLIVTPTSPSYERDTHLGVAIAAGPGFPAGSSLESSSTRRKGIVTLPDVAPTVLSHLGVERPAPMNGRPIVSVAAAASDRMLAAVDLDEESVFMDDAKDAAFALFSAFQVTLYVIALAFFVWNSARRDTPLRRGIETGSRLAALAVVAFPVVTYVLGLAPTEEMGTGAFLAVLVALDAALVAAVSLAASDPLDRLLALAALTVGVLVIDLTSGAHLQLNTVFGYSPIVAGRFAGAGNTTFSFLGAGGLLTAALVAQRWRRTKPVLAAIGLLFVGLVVVDGAPQFGSDVGGIVSLVPALGITWLLFTGRRPTFRAFVVAAVVAAAVVAIFLAVDFAGPPEDRTHLARFVEDVQDRGADAFFETLQRKARSNVLSFRTTIWSLVIPPSVAVMWWLLSRPRGRWKALADTYPRLREGLVGGLVLAVIGFAVNDSGISIPAMILSFLVPMMLLVHLSLERTATR